MSVAQLANAITMMDENILSDILEERYKRITRTRKTDRSLVTICRFPLAMATIAAACVIVVILAAPHLIRQPNTNNLPDAPQYIAAFSSPELEALYKEHPYSELLPQKIPETLAFVSSYRTEYDPIANPNNKQYLSLFFGAEKNSNSLEVKVKGYDGKVIIADPEKPDTYDLSLYYRYLETPGAVGADAPKMISLFNAETLSKSIAEKRMYVFADGLCKAEIEILCGDYIVSYHYVGAELSAQSFYDMITSSLFFMDTTGSKAILDNYPQAPLLGK